MNPIVSVVMSVYNGGQCLEETLLSVLTQQGCNLEFIVVNDGSIDDSGKILDAWALKDNRLRIIHQENTGLTKALIIGCAAAKGRYIARQDVGDISLPGRLYQQCEYLKEHASVAMVASAARFTAPSDEVLFDAISPGVELEKSLAQLDVDALKGPPHHGGTMFRRDFYNKVGGYRSTFVVAQDIDLWLRLSEIGTCFGLCDVLYRARLNAGGISSLRQDEQYRLGSLAIECAQYRRSGKDDSVLISKYQPVENVHKRKSLYREKAAFYYFVASCIRKMHPLKAVSYYAQAFWQYSLLVVSAVSAGISKHYYKRS